MERFGQHPDPSYRILQLSDPHFLAYREPLFGAVDSCPRGGGRPEQADAIVVTEDIADRGEPEAYDGVAQMLEPLANDLGAQLLWVMGNHDERAVFSVAVLALHHPPLTSPVRIIGLIEFRQLDGLEAYFNRDEV